MNELDAVWDEFERGRWGFGHRAHLRVAYEELRQHGSFEALPRFAKRLQRLADSLGKPDKYHETLTGLWLLLVQQRMQETEAEDFEGFVTANPDLLDHEAVPRRYYTEETLASPRARQYFVLPDRGLTAR